MMYNTTAFVQHKRVTGATVHQIREEVEGDATESVEAEYVEVIGLESDLPCPLSSVIGSHASANRHHHHDN